MATLTVTPPLGRPLMYLHKAQMEMEKRYLQMRNCKSCDQQIAQHYKDAAEFLKDLKQQLEKQA